jgi:hypothetical protein
LQPAYGADNHIHTKAPKNQPNCRTKTQDLAGYGQCGIAKPISISPLANTNLQQHDAGHKHNIVTSPKRTICNAYSQKKGITKRKIFIATPPPDQHMPDNQRI